MKTGASEQPKRLSEIEAAIRVRMSPELLRWFTKYPAKHGDDRTLPFEERAGEYFYSEDDLTDFDRYLWQPWPIAIGATRPHVPAGVSRELKIEAHHHCAFCDRSHSGEGAHIDPVHRSRCNHPHNLIWSCPNHHTEYDAQSRIPTILTSEQVRFIKDMLLEGRVRTWRVERRTVAGYLSMIAALEQIVDRLEDAKNVSVRQALMLHANALLRATHKSAEADIKEPVSKLHHRLVSSIAAIAPVDSPKKLRDAVVNADTAASRFLRESRLIECPLCEGSGEHNRHRCPICQGEGTLPEERDEIDLRPFRQIECPLCEGTTEHNRAECPVCFGVGTIDEGREENLDLTPYRQVRCPICKGSGTHNRFDCPTCSGVGTIDEGVAENLDTRPYRQIKCPLCEGSGEFNRSDCPVCHAVGTIDAGLEEQLDLRPYQLGSCPLCEGSGTHRRHDCPACGGTGKMPHGQAEHFDTSPYRQIECPLCDGSGTHRRHECPFCDGQGKVDAGVAENFDPSDFQ